jgi:hypothetical protein
MDGKKSVGKHIYGIIEIFWENNGTIEMIW